jgi:hypothetical protein
MAIGGGPATPKAQTKIIIIIIIIIGWPLGVAEAVTSNTRHLSSPALALCVIPFSSRRQPPALQPPALSMKSQKVTLKKDGSLFYGKKEARFLKRKAERKEEKIEKERLKNEKNTQCSW